LVALIALFFFLYVGGEVGFANWLYTYTVRLNLADATTAAYLNAAFWGALTLGRLLSIPIAARFSPRAVMAVDLAGSMLSIGIVLLWPASITALWAGTLGLGFSMASLFPTTLSFAEQRMHISGKVNGWFFAGSAAGGMVIPWLIGQWFELAGPHVVMLMVAADLVIAMVVLVLLIVYSNRVAPAAHKAHAS
jgi:FHS family Na+ dependent glucose MFS transporter 1